ncbi:hypothetical protein ES705_46717 [subsurface metagenome]
MEVQRDYQRLKDSLPRFNREYIQLKEDFSQLKKEKTFKMLDVSVTAYAPVESQTDSTPYIMASGKRITKELLKGLHIAAVSRNLLKRFNPEAPFDYGDFVWVPFRIEDTMNKRYIDSMDLLMEESMVTGFGRQERSIVFIDK